MPCRVVVTDVDGTLTEDRGTYSLSLEALAALKALLRRGIVVGIATANGHEYARHIARYLGVYPGGPIISENGCILEVGRSTRALCSVELKWLDEVLPKHVPGLKPSTQNPQRIYDMAYTVEGDPYAALGAVKHLLDSMGLDVEVVYSGYALHVRQRGVDKGTAVRALCDVLGISCGEVLAVGDSAVDVGMLRTCIGVAVADADPEARAAARHVTNMPSGLGFAEAARAVLRGEYC